MAHAVPGGTAAAMAGLMAAISWGGGDFAGGMGAKAEGSSAVGALRVMLSAHSVSLLCLAVLIEGSGGFPWSLRPALWGLGCGVVAGLSIAAFYVALARGTMGVSAAISGLLAAAIPAATGSLLEGRPGPVRLAGFALAAAAIWLVASPKPGEPRESRTVMWLAIGGGVGFGLYFAGLKFSNGLGVLPPLALARTGSVLTCAVLLLCLRDKSGAEPDRRPWLSRRGWMWALAVALLDSGGNLFYILATRLGRLDVAAVLAALYPASTILLAAVVLHERPGRLQVMGMALAAFAVVLVTL